MLVLFIGPPGAGKGSLARMCQDHFSFLQVSTGNLCRKHIQEGTQMGKEMDFAIKSGKLVNDTVINDMVAECLFGQEMDTSIILDGYPRTVPQAALLEKLITSSFPSLKVTIIRLKISNQEVIKRLSMRYICDNKECQTVYSVDEDSSLAAKTKGICDYCGHTTGRRSDDTPEAITERLKGYYGHEKAVLDFYVKKGQLVQELDVEKPIENVFKDLREIMKGEPV